MYVVVRLLASTGGVRRATGTGSYLLRFADVAPADRQQPRKCGVTSWRVCLTYVCQCVYVLHVLLQPTHIHCVVREHLLAPSTTVARATNRAILADGEFCASVRAHVVLRVPHYAMFVALCCCWFVGDVSCLSAGAHRHGVASPCACRWLRWGSSLTTTQSNWPPRRIVVFLCAWCVGRGAGCWFWLVVLCSSAVVKSSCWQLASNAYTPTLHRHSPPPSPQLAC